MNSDISKAEKYVRRHFTEFELLVPEKNRECFTVYEPGGGIRPVHMTEEVAMVNAAIDEGVLVPKQMTNAGTGVVELEGFGLRITKF